VEIVRDTFAGLVMTVRGFVFSVAGALVGLLSLAPVVVALVAPPVLVGLAGFVAALRAMSARQRAYVLADEDLADGTGIAVRGLRDIAACGAEEQIAGRLGTRVDAQARAERSLAWMTAVRNLCLVAGGWLPLVLLLVAAILAFSTSSAPNGRLITAILSLERSVLVMQAGMLLFLMLFSSRLGLTWKHHSFGISLGFGIYASGQLVISTLFAQLGTSFGEAYTLLQTVLYTAMTTIWLVYLASPEPARVALESAFAPKPVLERWNDVLLRRSLQPQSAFLTNLERIVDDVMTRSE